MTRRTLVAVLCVAGLTAGCSAAPKVTYEVITKAEADATGKLKFVLPRSLILLERKTLKDEPARLTATSVPTDLPLDDQARLYAIVPVEQFGVKTHLKLTYVDNSRIVSSVGVEVEDNRVKTIGQIAGALIAAAGIVALKINDVDIPPRLPVVIDPKGHEKAARRWVPLPRNPEWVYQLKVEDRPWDAVATASFFDGKETTAFPYSACRDATLYVLKGSGKTDAEYDKALGDAWVFGLKLADPQEVLTIGLPAKGKVDMHTACGANVTSEKSGVDSVWAVIGELIKQATAIKKAYDAAPKSP